ncbi:MULTISPECIES: hypothetical protein [unclassified Aeromonas]|uniref:hypothetical protein n=1 Tax=unclassified Aeromonas TaxID=257493 RepID=UPI003528ECDA
MKDLKSLHSQIAYHGITKEELSLLTREQLVGILTGEDDLLEEVFGALIIVEHGKFDKKLARRKHKAAQLATPSTH